MKFRIIILILAFLVLINTSYASDIKIDTYSYDFKVLTDNINVENVIKFKEGSIGIFEFDIPEDATSIKIFKDNIEISYADEINIDNTKELKLKYTTKEFLERSNFLITIRSGYDIDNLKIKLKLPEGATLTKPIKDETLQGGSAYPIPSKLYSDGLSLILEWERYNFKVNDEISILVIFNQGKDLLPIIILSVVILILVIGFVLFIYKQKKPKIKKIKRLKETKTIKEEKEPSILKHLKENEQQIIRILSMREGQCEQGTLRVLTDFSKAKLSRILSELEERKIIIKEKRGKKNLVFLKK